MGNLEQAKDEKKIAPTKEAQLKGERQLNADKAIPQPKKVGERKLKDGEKRKLKDGEKRKSKDGEKRKLKDGEKRKLKADTATPAPEEVSPEMLKSMRGLQKKEEEEAAKPLGA